MLIVLASVLTIVLVAMHHHYGDSPLNRSEIDSDRRGSWVFVPRNPTPYAGGSLMVSQAALRTLITDSEVHGECLKVFLYLCTELDFENWIMVPQSDVAYGLGMKRPSVSRQIALLEKKQVILRGPRVGRSWTWRLNPEYGWKGNLRSLDAYRRQKV